MRYDKEKTVLRLSSDGQEKVKIAEEILNTDKHFKDLTSQQKLRLLDSFILNIRVEELSNLLHEIKYLETNYAVNTRKRAKLEIDSIDEESYEILKSCKHRHIKRLRRMAINKYWDLKEKN